VSRVRAIVFDFNGTLSADEPILCEIFGALFAARDRPLSAQEYFDELAGLSDPEIVRRWLGRDYPDVESVIAERVDRYRAAVSDGTSIREPVREAVRYAAGKVPVAIVTGAARKEVEPVVEAAGLAPHVRAIVASDDVVEGKPDPEGYLKALVLLGLPARASGSEPQSPLRADEVVVFEDTEAGIAAAKAAGMRCIAVEGTLKPERLAAADALVGALDVDVVRRVLT
jgi:beta-phosphoglucomutase-like phosphatase (HAD superfamily)